MLERRPNGQSDSAFLQAAGRYNSRVLLPELEAQSDGAGPEIDVGPDRGKLLVLTLSIDYTIERQGLIISVWGSPDTGDWLRFPPARVEFRPNAHPFQLRPFRQQLQSEVAIPHLSRETHDPLQLPANIVQRLAAKTQFEHTERLPKSADCHS